MDCQWEPAESVPATCVACGTVYKGPSDKPPRRNCKPGGVIQHIPRIPGAGDYLSALIGRDVRAKVQPGCGCPEWIAKMNGWGPDGCREHREEIIDHMIDEAKRRKWKIEGRPILSITARVGTKMPFGAAYARRWARQLVDEAIRLTEAGAEQ